MWTWPSTRAAYIETSRPTTHERPTYLVGGVVHYCVTNMPGAVARTSTTALTNATFPYVMEIARKGYGRAARKNPALAAGLNIVRGRVCYPDLAAQYRVPLAGLTEVL